MIHRNVEETLNLLRVQINRQDAVRARRDEQVGHKLGRDRNAWLVLAVIAIALGVSLLGMGYLGYGILIVIVGLAAGVNLF